MSSCKVLKVQDSREMKAEVWQMLGSDIKTVQTILRLG